MPGTKAFPRSCLQKKGIDLLDFPRVLKNRFKQLLTREGRAFGNEGGAAKK